jgi:hypothetical protein
MMAWSIPAASMSPKRRAPMSCRRSMALDDGGCACRRRSRVESPQTHESRIVESFRDQALVGRENLLGDERFLGGDPQVTLAAARFQFGH